MKKFLAMLLAAMLVLSMGIVAFAEECTGGESCAHVAAIGNEHYETLKDAVNAVTDDTFTEINVLCDVDDGVGVIIPSGRKITINFGGHTYTVTSNLAGSPGTESQCFQLLKDSKVTLKNGTITSSVAKMVVQNYCDLTLENITLDGSNLAGTVPYTLSNNFGNTVITGNTNIIANTVGVAFDVWYGMSSSYDNGVKVTFDDNFTGSVKGKIEYGQAGRVNDANWTEKAALEIKNGNFNANIVYSGSGVDFNMNEANIKVTGGTHTDNVSAYVPVDTAVGTVGGRYVVSANDIRNAVSNAEPGTAVAIIKGSVTLENGVTLGEDSEYTVPAPTPDPKPIYRDTVTITIGSDKNEPAPEDKGEENPNTGAPVLAPVFAVLVAAGAVAAKIK